jgi:uncharacterized Zn-finger protein
VLLFGAREHSFAVGTVSTAAHVHQPHVLVSAGNSPSVACAPCAQVFKKVDYNNNGLIEPLEVEVAILAL